MATRILSTMAALAALALATAMAGPGGPAAARGTGWTGSVESSAPRPVPEVLAGDTWLRHLREDLLPYWEMTEALGTPPGNFPTFRDELGALDPERGTWRGVSTLARGVYGYSVAFHLTGDERYLVHARAGLRWLEEHGHDSERGGWYRDLTDTGAPLDPEDDKQLFDLASVGMAYGMYFNVTREPWAETGLLGVRDLIFEHYRDRASGQFLDALSADLAHPVDLGDNGGDIVNLLVPGTALLLPYADLLSDPVRRSQFRAGLRVVTEELIARHRNPTAPRTWWFWGRTGRIGVQGSAQTDFGHTIKSHEMIHNANEVFADRPWDALASDRDVLLDRAWDESAARWNDDLRNFTAGAVDPDSAWWVHNEADQTLASLNLREDFARSDWLARSAQSWLDVFVDPTFPHETWARPLRDGSFALPGGREKAGRGKNMYHVFEHTLVMYLHGRAMEGRPAELFYALPEDLALTAEAEPYWFDATTEHRVVGDAVGALPGHRHVTVGLSGLDQVPDPVHPPPQDDVAPVTDATLTPPANEAGWSATPVTLTLTATDDVAGVREVRAQVRDLTGRSQDEAWISPGDELTLPFTDEGDYVVTFAAVDRVGNAEPARSMRVRVDLTAPRVSGMPTQPCRIWPPDRRMVQVADVVGVDDFSGLSRLDVEVSVDEPAAGDVEIDGGLVRVRATRDGQGDGRAYTVTARVGDEAGNVTTAAGTCVVPHDQRP